MDSHKHDRSSQPLPVVRLDSKTIPLEHQFDAWRDGCAPLFDMTPGKREFSASCEAYLLDDLVVTQVSFDRQVFTRHRKLLGDTDYVTIHLYFKGSVRGEIDNQPFLIEPDRIAVHDFGHPYKGTAEDSQSMGVVIPRHRLTSADWIYKRAPFISWQLDSPQGRFLETSLKCLWDQLPHATEAEASGLASSLVGMVDGLITATRKQECFEPGDALTLEILERYVASNLARRDLDAQSICRAFHCSRASLYRLFQPVGGVKRYIRDQRLRRCFQTLATNPPSKVRIRSVAEQWGFFDETSFHRLFRSHFGQSPSDVVGTRLESESHFERSSGYNEQTTRLRNWLMSL